MRRHLIAVSFATLFATAVALSTASAQRAEEGAAREARIQTGSTSLYTRAVGKGPPVIVLHGGPDFDHAYLLPDLDRLGDAFQLIYYDQRGRGDSAAGVRPEDVTLESEIDDLDRVRRHYGLDAPILLGHSWGTVLALEYAARHPTRASRLILMNPAPMSAADYALLRESYLAKIGASMDEQRKLLGSAAYREGDPETVAARYRIHFKPAFARADDYENLMTVMRAQFIKQGKEGILKARAVEDRLMTETWSLPGYDLTPRLRTLSVPTLVIWGDHDFIPLEVSEHIARALPDAELVTLEGCGHFAYLECAAAVRKHVDAFVRR